MNKKLLLTTALVGFVFASNANAMEIGDWVLSGNETSNIKNQEDTTAKSITVKDGAILNVSNTDVKINTAEGTGAFKLQDTASLTMQDSAIIAKNIETTGGVANLTGGNSVSADSMSFKNTELNFSGTGNELRSQNISFDGVTANVEGAGALSIAGGGQTVDFLNTNNVNTKDKGVEFKNATANISGILTITDTSGDKDIQGKVVLNDKGNNTNVNLSGILNADVSGTGTADFDFKTSNAQVNGSFADVNTYFKSNHTLSNAITGTFSANEMMIDNGGSLLADKDFSANEVIVGSSDVSKFGTGNLTLSGDHAFSAKNKLVVNSGSTLNLGNSTLTSNTGNVFQEGSTLIVGIDKNGGGKITGNINVDKANLKTIIALDTQGKSHAITDGSVTGDWIFDANGNSLYNQKLVSNKTIEISKKSTGEIAANTGANGNQAGAVSAVLGGTSNNQSFNNVANNINTLLQSSNPSEVAAGLKMVDQMSADTSSSAQSTTSQTATQVFNAVGTRLSGGSVAGAMQGKSSGDSSLDNGALWAQGLVSKAELDGANGFDADTNGIAFGAEKQITDTTKAGIGYAYSKTDIDSASRTTDVDTHTAIVYGEYKPSNWFVNGIASYGWGSYDESNAVKKASYDVDSFGLQAMTGYDIETNGMMLTPETGLRYVNIKQKSYTDSLGSKIGANSSDILTGVAGLKVSKEFTMDNGMTLKPEARAALTYDLSNDDANSVVTLANGSSYSTNGEALDKFGQEIGLGLTAGINENVEVSLGYEGRFRQDYSDHSGLLNAKYKF